MKSTFSLLKCSTRSIPHLQGMERWKPATVRVFHTFHTFHTFLYTYTHRRTHTRAHTCVCMSIFGMEGMEGMEQQVKTWGLGFHTLTIRYGRYGT